MWRKVVLAVLVFGVSLAVAAVLLRPERAEGPKPAAASEGGASKAGKKVQPPWEHRPLTTPDRFTPPTREARAEGRRDVVLVTIDTLRADVLGAYGDARGLTPALDRLAAEGVTFTRAYASSSWTVPTVASLTTGLYAHEHGVEKGAVASREVVGQEALGRDVDVLAERMQALGLRTYGYTTNIHLAPELGYDQGFDRYQNVRFEEADDVLAAVRGWAPELAAGASPFFLWAHYFDPHDTYRAAQPWFDDLLAEAGPQVAKAREAKGFKKRVRSWAGRPGKALWKAKRKLDNPVDLAILRALYGSEVRYTDEWVRRMLASLGEGTPPIVVITADHGEELYDAKGTGHRHTLREELVHVPLIVWAPGLVPAGVRVDTPVSLVNLLPTLVRLAGGDAEAAEGGTSGRDLAPLWRGEAWEGGGFPLSVETKNGRIDAWIDGTWKLVRRADGGVRLYDLARDPQERKDRSAAETERTAAMLAALDARLAVGRRAAPATVTTTDPETLEQLEAMGYVDR